jgi:hypothetical protein
MKPVSRPDVRIKDTRVATRDLAAASIRLVALLAAAIGVGTCVALAVALLGHELLVFRFGEDGIAAIDDTPLMFVLVAGAYLAGGLRAWRSSWLVGGASLP